MGATALVLDEVVLEDCEEEVGVDEIEDVDAAVEEEEDDEDDVADNEEEEEDELDDVEVVLVVDDLPESASAAPPAAITIITMTITAAATREIALTLRDGKRTLKQNLTNVENMFCLYDFAITL